MKNKIKVLGDNIITYIDFQNEYVKKRNYRVFMQKERE